MSISMLTVLFKSPIIMEVEASKLAKRFDTHKFHLLHWGKDKVLRGSLVWMLMVDAGASNRE